MQLLTSSVLNDKRLFEINNESFKIILENLWNFLFRTITTHFIDFSKLIIVQARMETKSRSRLVADPWSELDRPL